MRGIFYENYGDQAVLQDGEISLPELAADEVLIKVHAASVNPFDWKLRNGMLKEFFTPTFPITPGRDGCGEIVKLGGSVATSGQKKLLTGQQVSFISSRMLNGSLAEYAAVQAQGFVVPAADTLDLEQAAALPLGGVSAWVALVDTAEIQAGMRVLVHGGSGGVGSIAIQIARHFGAEVFATCRAANADIVSSFGGTPLPYDEAAFTSMITDCDVVFDTVGGQVHDDSYQVLKPGGCMVYLLAQPFTDRSEEFGVSVRQAVVHNQPDKLQQVMDLAAAGRIRAVIGHSLEFAATREAMQLSETGAARGKIVVRIVPQSCSA